MPESVHVEELCSVSYLRPVAGCPVYREYFKNGDDVPSQLCSIHQGTLRQQTTRAISGIFRSIGRSIAGIFRESTNHKLNSLSRRIFHGRDQVRQAIRAFVF